MKKQFFLENLRFLYGLMVASEPLLIEAGERTKNDAFRAFCNHHLEEEKDHAKWLREDLNTEGYEPPAIDWQAATLAGIQYYLIRHVAPEALLGYMVALESSVPTLAQVEELEMLYGKPLLRTVRHHAEVDVGHTKELRKFINETPGLPLEIIHANTNYTLALSSLIFKEIEKNV